MKQDYIGENIRIYRERAHLTQQELADKIGVSWEMISRYERSASSPLKKISAIANALNVYMSTLLEKHIPERLYRMEYKVPLFTKLPSSNKFLPEHTNNYYNCPEWILKRDLESIALETDLVSSDLLEYKKNGILYISTKCIPKRNDLIVLKDGFKLVLIKSNGRVYSNILGKVLAQEIRF